MPATVEIQISVLLDIETHRRSNSIHDSSIATKQHQRTGSVAVHFVGCVDLYSLTRGSEPSDARVAPRRRRFYPQLRLALGQRKALLKAY